MRWRRFWTHKATSRPNPDACWGAGSMRTSCTTERSGTQCSTTRTSTCIGVSWQAACGRATPPLQSCFSFLCMSADITTTTGRNGARTGSPGLCRALRAAGRSGSGPWATPASSSRRPFFMYARISHTGTGAPAQTISWFSLTTKAAVNRCRVQLPQNHCARLCAFF